MTGYVVLFQKTYVRFCIHCSYTQRTALIQYNLSGIEIVGVRMRSKTTAASAILFPREQYPVVQPFPDYTGNSTVSVPYHYSRFSAPDMCEWFYLKYKGRHFCVGHRTAGTDTELTRH
jgi:hypothetical protein